MNFLLFLLNLLSVCLVIWSLNQPEPSGPHRPVTGIAFLFIKCLGQTTVFRYPAGARTDTWRPTARYSHILVQWLLQTISLGSKQPDREASHSPSYSVEIKNGGTLPLIQPYAFTV